MKKGEALKDKVKSMVKDKVKVKKVEKPRARTDPRTSKRAGVFMD